MSDPDADLVKRVGAGDARAATVLVRKHAPRLIALARRMLGDAAEAEDTAQEALLRAWKAAPAWRFGEARFDTWLHRVTLNLCYDRLRRRREVLDPEAGSLMVDPSPLPGDGLVASERTARIEAALAALPERQRAAIALCHYQELSNIQAAAALEVSVDALESLLARARRSLKSLLASELQSP